MVKIIPAERLEIKLSDYQDEIQRFHEMENEKSGKDHLSPRNIAWFLMMDSENISKWSYLAGHRETCIKWSRIAGEEMIEYLTGEWKKIHKHDDGTIDPDRWFEEKDPMTWVAYLEDGLAWPAIGGHWDVVDELLGVITPKMSPDDDGKAARDYYVGLASWWNDETNTDWIEEVKKVRGAGSKAYHMLCDALAALIAEDMKSFEKAIGQYIKHFLKRRDHDQQFPMAATFLWLVARRKGFTPELPEELGKYIFLPLEEL